MAETLIVVAIGRACGTILLACLCNQVANLARRCGKRAVMMVRHLARHGADGSSRSSVTLCSVGDAACVAMTAARAGYASLYRCAEVYHVACLVFRRGSWSHTGCRQTTECHDLRHGYGHFRPPLLCRQLVASQSTTMRLAPYQPKQRVVILIR